MKLKLKGTTTNSNHDHALLSPSAARKWLGCPAALACEFGVPNESGAAAVNGTAMHHISEVILARLINGEKADAKPYKGSHVLNNGKGPIKALAAPMKGAVLITDDFVSQVDKYVDYCRPIIDAAEVVEVESRVNLTRILHPGVEVDGKPLATFGTADLVAVMPDGMLIVGDLKTGRHRVSAKENKQMMLYALGLLRVYRRLYDITAVRLVIFQPYAGGADEWDITPEALEQFGKFAQTRALKAIDAFQRGKKGLKPADFRPSADACQWCRFAEKCQAKRKVATSGIDFVVVSDETPLEMSVSHLKMEWDKLPLMSQHIADIEKAMYAALMRGEQIEGLKLVEGRPGNRSWDNPVWVEELACRHRVDYDLLIKKSVMNPAEAEKVLKGAYDRMWAELETHIERKPGQPSITTADDKRPAWAPVSDDDLSN